MMWWGPDWGWAGALLAVICMVVMARMMGHGGHSGHRSHGSRHGGAGAAERTLANRLASGEIDVDEYVKLREVMRRGDGTTGA
jgi:uncharacterized membrane protein